MKDKMKLKKSKTGIKTTTYKHPKHITKTEMYTTTETEIKRATEKKHCVLLGR